MHSALPAVAVAALLVLAGCSGADPIPGPDEAGKTTTAHVEARYPPGVDESGVVSTSRLLAAHRTQIRETGAVVEIDQSLVVRAENGTVTLDSRASIRSTPGLTRGFRVQVFEVFGDDGAVSTRQQAMYANETTIFLRHDDGDNVTFTTESRDKREGIVERDVTRTSTLQEVLIEHDFHVVDTERRDGRTITTLRAEETEFTDDGTRQFDATVEVASDGRIRSLTVTRNPDANTPVDRRQLRVTWTNGTTVEPPEWVP